MSDFLTLVFGAFVTVNVFEDGRPVLWVGNLDTVFGLAYYRLMDVAYLLVPIAVFLLYGRSRGSLRPRAASVLLFVSFVAALSLLRLDDVLVVLHYAGLTRQIDPTTPFWTYYWAVAACLFSCVSVLTFLAFGRSCATARAEDHRDRE